jgi:predicted dehydrogenase
LVQELLSDGYVGEVLSTTMVGLSVPGNAVVQANAYMLDKTNGANVLTIALGHSLDTLNYLLGEFTALSAVTDLRRPLVTIDGTGEQVVKTAADQIAVIGTLTSGATASIHIREAVAGGTGFLWEINGTDGTLRFTADAAYPEIYPLTVRGAHGRNEPANLASRRRSHRRGQRSAAWKERQHITSDAPTRRSRQTSTTAPTPCRTSPTPSHATRSLPPSRDPRHQGNA